MNVKTMNRIAGHGFLALLLLAGWFLALGPRLGDAGEVAKQTEAAEQANQHLVAEIRRVEGLRDGISTAKVQADKNTRKFPSTADQTDLFAQIRAAASKAGLSEKSLIRLTISSPTIVTGGAVTLGAPGEQQSQAGPQAQTNPQAQAAPQAATPSLGGQLASMKVEINAKGSRQELTKFVSNLENMDRAFLTSSVSLSGEGKEYSLSVNGNMFMLPELMDPTAPSEGTSANLTGEGSANDTPQSQTSTPPSTGLSLGQS